MTAETRKGSIDANAASNGERMRSQTGPATNGGRAGTPCEQEKDVSNYAIRTFVASPKPGSLARGAVSSQDYPIGSSSDAGQQIVLGPGSWACSASLKRFAPENRGTTLFAQNDTIEPFSSDLSAWDYGQSGIIFVASIVIGRVAHMVIKRLFHRSPADDFLGDLFGRIANYIILVIGLVYALEGLGVEVAPLLGALGIAGLALAIALQDILENFIAGILLQLRRPFTAGDEIQSVDHEGTVTSVDARTVTIRTPDGETVKLPSADVIQNPITNLTNCGRRRTTIEVGVAYGTDLDRAARIAIDAARDVEAVRENPPVEALVYAFGESSIDIAVRFWHEPSITSQWRTRDAVARAIARAFEANDITIPFPQRVLHRFSEDNDVA